MAYFPFFMDMEQMRGLVVGGGKVATRKVAQLLPYGPSLTVVTDEATEELKSMEDKITLILRSFKESDLDQMDFVVAASSDTLLNGEISRICKEKRIPVNVVDIKDECSFIFPSLVKEGSISIGISTGGNSPWIAKYLKDKVREAIPKDFGMMAEELGGWRNYVKEKVPTQQEREEIFTVMAETLLTKDSDKKHLSQEEIDSIIASVCSKHCSDTDRT